MSARVLVVDDILPNVKLLEAKLVSEYYEVVTARDGFECLTVAKEKKPDIILLDVMLPNRSGFDLCRAIRRDSRTPIIFLTGRPSWARRTASSRS